MWLKFQCRIIFRLPIHPYHPHTVELAKKHVKQLAHNDWISIVFACFHLQQLTEQRQKLHTWNFFEEENEWMSKKNHYLNQKSVQLFVVACYHLTCLGCPFVSILFSSSFICLSRVCVWIFFAVLHHFFRSSFHGIVCTFIGNWLSVCHLPANRWTKNINPSF